MENLYQKIVFEETIIYEKVCIKMCKIVLLLPPTKQVLVPVLIAFNKL